VFGGIVLALFKELYVANFVAGFAAIVIAMTCAYSGQSVMFAKITGEEADLVVPVARVAGYC
jgi:hypothetical protein